MPRLKVGDDELDIEALEAVEYNEDEEFQDYTGPTPPKKTVLRGFVKLAYWTLDGEGERMIKSLFIAAENTGDKAKFNGCPIWDNTSIKASTKFRWAPLMRAWGITLADIKRKLYVKPEEFDHETRGAVIEKIGTWEPGEESESAWVMVLTGTHKYDGANQVDVGKWMPWVDEEPEDADDEADEVDADEEVADDEAEEEVDEADADEDEVDEDYQEDEAEEEPAPPARGRKPAGTRPAAATASKPAAGRTATRTAKPAAAKPAAATTARRPASGKPAARRGAAAKGSAAPPPF